MYLVNQTHYEASWAKKHKTISKALARYSTGSHVLLTWDSQATLQGIKSAHGEYIKVRYPQLYTQAKNYQKLEIYKVDRKVEACGLHIRRKLEKRDEYAHTC